MSESDRRPDPAPVDEAGRSPGETAHDRPEGDGDAAIADRVPGNWVDRLAPEPWRPYLRLSRADRPIGTWLLLLPCWWGALLGALAAPELRGWLTVWIVVATAVGAFLMRGAGCT
jgi:4-hydroxybenzoate polyprenyltransferase